MSRAAKHGLGRIFPESRIRFGERAENKNAAPFIFNDFCVLAGETKVHQRAEKSESALYSEARTLFEEGHDKDLVDPDK